MLVAHLRALFWTFCNLYNADLLSVLRGIGGYSSIGLMRLVYSLVFVFVVQLAKRFSFVSANLALASLSSMCFLMPYGVNSSPRNFPFVSYSSLVLFIVMGSGVVSLCCIDISLNLSVFVFIFHCFSNWFMRVIAVIVLALSMGWDLEGYVIVCVMSSAYSV